MSTRDDLGAGLGSRMLECFIASVVPRLYPGATCVVSSLSILNPRSIRVLEKIGFIAHGVVEIPSEIDPEMVMVRQLVA